MYVHSCIVLNIEILFNYVLVIHRFQETTHLMWTSWVQLRSYVSQVLHEVPQSNARSLYNEVTRHFFIFHQHTIQCPHAATSSSRWGCGDSSGWGFIPQHSLSKDPVDESPQALYAIMQHVYEDNVILNNWLQDEEISLHSLHCTIILDSIEVLHVKPGSASQLNSGRPHNLRCFRISIVILRRFFHL